MQPSLAMPKLRRKPIDQDGSPAVERRAGPTATDTILAFGRFRVLRRQRLLLADGVPVELGTRAFDILMVLLEADGALVTHNEMQSRVWPGIVVARDNLKVQISALRKALGEDRELIRTENGRGYRFTAAVRVTVAVPECLSASRATARERGRKAASLTDLSVIASELARLEERLAEALNLLRTHRTDSRSRRSRSYAGHFRRRIRRGRSAPALTLPHSRAREGRGQCSTALCGKPLDPAC
jgi:DNA-binding winged helix-turn-helix (wHTH) protein